MRRWLEGGKIQNDPVPKDSIFTDSRQCENTPCLNRNTGDVGDTGDVRKVGILYIRKSSFSTTKQKARALGKATS